VSASSEEGSVKFLFSLEGELDRRGFAAAALPVFFVPYALTAAILLWKPPVTEFPWWWFWLNPLSAVLHMGAHKGGPIPLAAQATIFIAVLVVSWVLASLAFRRAREAPRWTTIAPLVVIPGLQALVIAWLCIVPRSVVVDAGEPLRSRAPLRAIVLGLLAGVTLCAAVAAPRS
jgi:hypothetical protein